MTKWLGGLLAAGLLAGCAAGPEMPGTDSPLPAPGQDSCDAARHAGLIGQKATALEKVLILGPVRVLRPGDMATMDHLPGRINFRLDAQDRIAAITCG